MLSAILPMAFLLFACANDPVAEGGRFERMAKAYCGCIADTDLQSLNDKAKNASPSLSESETLAIFTGLQAEFDKAKECAVPIKSNLGGLKDAELDSLLLKLPSTCPQVASDKDIIREMLGE